MFPLSVFLLRSSWSNDSRSDPSQWVVNISDSICFGCFKGKVLRLILKYWSLHFCVCRTYCEIDIDPAHRKLTQLQAVIKYLTGKEKDLRCKLWKNIIYLGKWKRDFLWMVSLFSGFFCRWWAVIATDSFWCCGYSSYGGILDRSHAKHIWVNKTNYQNVKILFKNLI